MARIEGDCTCARDGCKCKRTAKWVDKITGNCRDCEIEHGDRWGHNTARAEEATPDAGERTI